MNDERGDRLERLFRAAHADARLRELSDTEIADLLMEHVWPHKDISAAESALIEHAIDRLKRAGGGPLPYEEDKP